MEEHAGLILRDGESGLQDITPEHKGEIGGSHGDWGAKVFDPIVVAEAEIDPNGSEPKARGDGAIEGGRGTIAHLGSRGDHRGIDLDRDREVGQDEVGQSQNDLEREGEVH